MTLIIEPFRAARPIELRAPREFIGQKAEGLLRVPRKWQPPFFILTTELVANFFEAAQAQDAHLDKFFSDSLVASIDAAMQSITSDAFVILRSSSIGEGIEQRGALESLRCGTAWLQVVGCLRSLAMSYDEAASGPLAIIVQQLVSMKQASGHLSNERRVSRRKTTWVWELDAIAGIGDAGVNRFSSLGNKAPSEDDRLLCKDVSTLPKILNQLAAWGSEQSERLHFEWIWDGSYVWVLQADRIIDRKGDPPAVAVQHLKKPKTIGYLRLLERESFVPDEGWQKLECVRAFRRCGLPAPDLWILRGADTIGRLRAGEMVPELKGDLVQLLEYPIVIRTDIRRSAQREGYLLPRTATVLDVETARDFLVSVASNVEEQDWDCIIFLLHRFIPARSSAYALAEPSKNRVRIDGIWGLPDGLLFYSHDSYEVNLSSTSAPHRKIRFKEEYLDPTPDGSWQPQKAVSPWDWGSSISDDELRIIADGTQRLAIEIGDSVQVMWFVGVLQQSGYPSCLPWFFDTEESPKGLESRRGSLLQENAVSVRRPSDLDELKRRHKEGSGVSLVTVRPMPDLLRDKDFLSDVANTAKQIGASVELEGSVLSHAYYILRRSGVPLSVRDPFLAKEDRKIFRKLVRDNIPTRIANQGEKAVTVRLSAKGLSGALRSKIVEEALELFWADKQEDVREELVDLTTTVEAFRDHLGLPASELERALQQKKQSRGGFEQGLVLTETVDSPLIGEKGREQLSVVGQGEGFGGVEEASASMGSLSRMPRVEGPSLHLPLVPPNPERLHLSYAFQISKVVVNVRYGEKDIVLEVVDVSDEEPFDERQQPLPFLSSGLNSN